MRFHCQFQQIAHQSSLHDVLLCWLIVQWATVHRFSRTPEARRILRCPVLLLSLYAQLREFHSWVPVVVEAPGDGAVESRWSEPSVDTVRAAGLWEVEGEFWVDCQLTLPCRITSGLPVTRPESRLSAKVTRY